ncbi:hypothetical protein CHUAL_012324 [Chamberlinius hualienensis]
MQPEDIECFACEMHDAVQCKYCQTKSFCLECLKRYKKWHIQPFLLQQEPQETAPPPDLGHTVNSLQQKANEIQLQLLTLLKTSNSTNDKWKNWKTSWINYDGEVNRLIDTYEKRLGSIDNLESALAREKVNRANDRKWIEVKRAKKAQWIADMDEKWTERRSKLLEKFKEERKVEWQKKQTQIRNDQSTIDATKRIWDETEDACWKAELSKWKSRWDAEVWKKWETEKSRLKAQTEEETFDWDMREEHSKKKRQNKAEIDNWKRSFKQLSNAAEPAEFETAIGHTEKLKNMTLLWLKNLEDLSPSEYYTLTKITLQMEDLIKLKEEDIKAASERRLNEEVEKHRQNFEREFQDKTKELEVEMNQRLIQYKDELSIEIDLQYSNQYNEKLAVVLNQHQLEINLFTEEVNERDMAIANLLEEIENGNQIQLMLKSTILLKDDEIQGVQLEMDKLKEKHQKDLIIQKEKFDENLEIARKNHEHQLVESELKLETTISNRWKRREIAAVRLSELLKKRVKEKNDQISRLLAQVRRDETRENEKITEAQLLITGAIDPMLENFAKMVSTQEQLNQLRQQLQEETAKLLNGNPNLIANYKQQLNQLQTDYSHQEATLTQQLITVENLQAIIAKNKCVDLTPFGSMLLNEVQIKLPGNTEEMQRYLQTHQLTPTQGNDSIDTAIDELVQRFGFNISN